MSLDLKNVLNGVLLWIWKYAALQGTLKMLKRDFKSMTVNRLINLGNSIKLNTLPLPVYIFISSIPTC